MVRKIELRFTGLQNDGDQFKININSPSEFYNSDIEFTFKNAISQPNDILIGVDSNATIFNFQIALSAFFSTFSWITVVAQPNGADVIMTTEDVNSSTITNTSDLFISHTTTVNPVASNETIILSRSPYFIDIAPSQNFDQAIMILRLWSGDKVINRPTLPTYTLSKLVVIAGQTNISFNINKIVNDYIKNSLGVIGQGANTFTTSVLDTIWVEAQITAYYQGTQIANTTKTYLGVDGFGYHEEEFNPEINTNVLNSINSHVVYEGQDYLLYFKTFGLTGITINGVIVPFTFNQSLNSQKVAYVNIKSFLNTNKTFSAFFQYGLATETHTFTVKSSCKYPFVNAVFKNKFGFWQMMPFNLINRKTIDVEDTTYNPYVSKFGKYSAKDHNTVSYNLNGKEKITCNTDYIPENYVEVMQQMMLSEQVYLQLNGQTIPVNKTTKSLSKKTKIADRLIQYTIDFDYSYKLINQVQ